MLNSADSGGSSALDLHVTMATHLGTHHCLPWWLSGAHLVHRTPKAPYVRLPAISLTTYHLRGHPVGGSPHGMHFPAHFLAVLFGTPKVYQFHYPSGGDHYVGTFDIPVDYPVGVKVVEALDNLPCVMTNGLLIQMAKPVLGEGVWSL